METMCIPADHFFLATGNGNGALVSVDFNASFAAKSSALVSDIDSVR